MVQRPSSAWGRLGLCLLADRRTRLAAAAARASHRPTNALSQPGSEPDSAQSSATCAALSGQLIVNGHRRCLRPAPVSRRRGRCWATSVRSQVIGRPIQLCRHGLSGHGSPSAVMALQSGVPRSARLRAMLRHRDGAWKPLQARPALRRSPSALWVKVGRWSLCSESRACSHPEMRHGTRTST